MIKVNATAQTRQEIKELADMYGARLVDITRNSMTIECCNTTERLEKPAGYRPALWAQTGHPHRVDRPRKGQRVV